MFSETRDVISLFPYVFPLADFGDAWNHTFSKEKTSSDFENQCFHLISKLQICHYVNSNWPLLQIF